MVKIITLLSIILLQGCLISQKVTIEKPGIIKLSQIDFNELESWSNADHKKALQSFLHSCNKFSKMAQNRIITKTAIEVKAGDFRDVCEIAQVVKTMNSEQAQNFFENWFKAFAISNKNGINHGVFTGYYEASLKATQTQDERFKYPIYAKPSDLKSNETYYSRAEIENGAIDDQHLELFYTDDKVDLFFMHIQGSGRIILPNGDEVRLAYAAKNNHKFTSIGGYMVEKGYLASNKVNAATIKTWLKNNPDKADEVMNINDSFIFFRVSNNEHIVGAQGVPLTPEHSIAVDNKYIPYGIPLWLNTELKQKDGTKEKYSNLLIAQDTGSAIKGPIRGDIFFGYGKKNEEKAYYMASRGKYHALLPMTVVDRMRKKN